MSNIIDFPKPQSIALPRRLIRDGWWLEERFERDRFHGPACLSHSPIAESAQNENDVHEPRSRIVPFRILPVSQ